MKPLLYIANVDAWKKGRLLDLLSKWPIEVRSTEMGDPVPTDAAKYRGVIIGGGLVPVAKAGEHAFMQDELALIESTLKEDIPLLGICLGAQLLAHSLGAKIFTGEAEIGYCPIEPVDHALERLSYVFQWHWEGFALPSGARRLAYSARFEQAFCYERAFGFQFHPDVRPKDIPGWLSAFPRERGLVDLEETLEQAARYDPVIEGWFKSFLGKLFVDDQASQTDQASQADQAV